LTEFLGLKQLATKNGLGAFVQDIREDIKGIRRKIAEFCHYHRWALATGASKPFG